MGQGDSARDFGTSESMKNAGILDVFPIFHTARLGQKIRRSPQFPLCGVALALFKLCLSFLWVVASGIFSCYTVRKGGMPGVWYYSGVFFQRNLRHCAFADSVPYF